MHIKDIQDSLGQEFEWCPSMGIYVSRVLCFKCFGYLLMSFNVFTGFLHQKSTAVQPSNFFIKSQPCQALEVLPGRPNLLSTWLWQPEEQQTYNLQTIEQNKKRPISFPKLKVQG